MSTKTIAFVIADLGSGGAQKIASSLMGHWANQGHNVHCITLDDGKNDFFVLSENVTRTALNLTQPSSNPLTALIANYHRIMSINGALESINPDVTISFIAPTNILSVLAARGLKTKLIISERNDPARQSFGWFWDTLRRLLYKKADIVTANSETAVKALSRTVPTHKLYLTPNHLPPPEPRYVKLISEKDNTILFVGRLHPQKAIDTLLKAFAKLEAPGWKLKIVGHGSLENELKQLAQNLGLGDSVNWVGQVPNPYEYYARAKIFVLPSRHEGTPNALLEAMSCALVPIVSDAIDGAKPFVTDENLIFPCDDVTALSQKLTALIQNNADLNTHSKNAQTAVQSLTPEKIFKQWDALIS